MANLREIKNDDFGGERPLFAVRNVLLNGVTVHAGESALKECTGVQAEHCRFEGKYPFWHNTDFVIRHSLFTEGARAAIWYSHNLDMSDTRVEAPKMFRDMDGIRLTDVHFTQAAETLWHCSRISLHRVKVEKGDYLFMHSCGIDIDDFQLDGNYSFQYCRDVTIRHAHINSKDAFWNSENMEVYDSVINGEYLGWHSRNLRLVRCHITGTQPLCYARNLIMEDCTMGDDGDLAFEYSSLHADIRGAVHSIKNPLTGRITADSVGQLILDEHLRAPGDCEIVQRSAMG